MPAAYFDSNFNTGITTPVPVYNNLSTLTALQETIQIGIESTPGLISIFSETQPVPVYNTVVLDLELTAFEEAVQIGIESTPAIMSKQFIRSTVISIPQLQQFVD